MRAKLILVFLQLFVACQAFSQSIPLFGNEIRVTISGLTFDAMEPFISADGNTLFFNSLNAGGNTNLYYANKLNDSTFNYVGMVGGTYDSSLNHLDAVASLDTLGNFFWTSLRGYPTTIENLHRGVYATGNVSNITRVYGDFNIYNFNYPFGWLIMDASISHQGDLLYYCNAKFDFLNTTCVGIPCEAKIGVAQKINDSTFNKVPNSDAIFSNINDTINYILYAPQVTVDGLELYFTRLQKNTVNTEICVSVRSSLTDTFSLPSVIYSSLGFAPEAASPSYDKSKIYYHKKDNSGVYQIYLRYRTGTTGINESSSSMRLEVFPNPTNDVFKINIPNPNEDFSVSVFSAMGQKLSTLSNNLSIDISKFSSGIYFIEVVQQNKIWKSKVIKD